jgi:predicted amidohydrolase
MISFRVALLQMVSCGDNQSANLRKGEEYCRAAAGMGADFALFPEMWSNGYSFFKPGEVGAFEIWKAQAIERKSGFFQHFVNLARELHIAIGLTYLENWENKPRNSISIIDRQGETLLTYAKVHTCEFDRESYLTPGDDFPVCNLKFEHGEVKLGAMICYDREFPESARILMLNGAEIILTPNACELEANRLCQFRTRASENMVGVAMANYAAPQDNGHSIAYDAVCFTKGGKSIDPLIIEGGMGEGIFLAEFDLESLRAWRKRETWGNAFRRPRLYSRLVSTDVKEPFLRKKATR